MDSRRFRDDFTRELLAREDRVSAEQYAEYRRRLDSRIEAAALPPPHVGAGLPRPYRRRLWFAACAVVAACFVFAFLSRRSGNLPHHFGAPPVVLDVRRLWIIDKIPTTPYEEAAQAHFVSLVTVREAAARQAEDVLLPLHLDRVLKDETGVRTPRFYLGVPNSKGAATFYPEGSRFVLYLWYSNQSGWHLRELHRLDERFAEQELPQIERCVAVQNARHSEDPKRKYQILLCPPSGKLDSYACAALTCRPDPQSADVLLGQLRPLHQRVLRGTPAPSPEAFAKQIAEPLRRLSQVLASAHEARAAVPVVECALRFPRGQRGEFYQRIPDLCQRADADTLARTRAVLAKELTDARGDLDDFFKAARALVALPGSEGIEVVIAAMNRRPISPHNARAALALYAVERQRRVREAWLQVLLDHKPSETPDKAEKALISQVVGLLEMRNGLTAEERLLIRRKLEKVRDGQADWFRNELARLSAA